MVFTPKKKQPKKNKTSINTSPLQVKSLNFIGEMTWPSLCINKVHSSIKINKKKAIPKSASSQHVKLEEKNYLLSLSREQCSFVLQLKEDNEKGLNQYEFIKICVSIRSQLSTISLLAAWSIKELMSMYMSRKNSCKIAP